MFLNNPASTRSLLTNNENAPSIHRSKSIGGNGTKKAAFNENAVKTPHQNKDASSKAKGGQTKQRRRRAFGDISNRKSSGGGSGGGKGAVVLKQTSSNNATQGSKNRTSLVKFSKTPSTKITATNKARLGGGSGMKSANSKPKQRAPSEYDGVFGATTRWASDDIIADESRSPFGLVPEEELDMVSNLRDEMSDRRQKESDERVRLELVRCEEQFLEQMRTVHEVDEKDVDGLGSMLGSCGISGNETDKWDLLDQKLPWEEEDGVYDPTEERRLSGSDPYSLWGDI
mmetsp:Transcript_11190/g.24609  ORF Transcript_11190/g.24609 Transcript_11190/m.24609 type:complete len:286 (-) Transcript_11190:73-930(-)|eukprot:CAMPEP_0172298876 /NCGR_PEP_ID=MMETSP1058-20130122/1329_1 /TAXON_ID=83371 /ORGANISM="Detonula confervacea, Strain CCMP 353" /LENGTH=285 /DNA_ID=CAMNT_0013008171 /DNA_START=152 /DNA_END=1009 /DNA_ORIENTATION=-